MTATNDSNRQQQQQQQQQDDFPTLFRSLGLKTSQIQRAIQCCQEQLVLTVEDLRVVASDPEDLREMFPHLGIRSRIKVWLRNSNNNNKSNTIQPNAVISTAAETTNVAINGDGNENNPNNPVENTNTNIMGNSMPLQEPAAETEVNQTATTTQTTTVVRPEPQQNIQLPSVDPTTNNPNENQTEENNRSEQNTPAMTGEEQTPSEASQSFESATEGNSTETNNSEPYQTLQEDDQVLGVYPASEEGNNKEHAESQVSSNQEKQQEKTPQEKETPHDENNGEEANENASQTMHEMTANSYQDDPMQGEPKNATAFGNTDTAVDPNETTRASSEDLQLDSKMDVMDIDSPNEKAAEQTIPSETPENATDDTKLVSAQEDAMPVDEPNAAAEDILVPEKVEKPAESETTTNERSESMQGEPKDDSGELTESVPYAAAERSRDVAVETSHPIQQAESQKEETLHDSKFNAQDTKMSEVNNPKETTEQTALESINNEQATKNEGPTEEGDTVGKIEVASKFADEGTQQTRLSKEEEDATEDTTPEPSESVEDEVMEQQKQMEDPKTDRTEATAEHVNADTLMGVDEPEPEHKDSAEEEETRVVENAVEASVEQSKQPEEDSNPSVKVSTEVAAVDHGKATNLKAQQGISEEEKMDENKQGEPEAQATTHVNERSDVSQDEGRQAPEEEENYGMEMDAEGLPASEDVSVQEKDRGLPPEEVASSPDGQAETKEISHEDLWDYIRCGLDKMALNMLQKDHGLAFSDKLLPDDFDLENVGDSGFIEDRGSNFWRFLDSVAVDITNSAHPAKRRKRSSNLALLRKFTGNWLEYIQKITPKSPVHFEVNKGPPPKGYNAKKERKEFEAEKQTILSNIPAQNKAAFKQLGFAKWKKLGYRPVMIVSPYDVPPASIREDWMKSYEDAVDKGTLDNLGHLVWWIAPTMERLPKSYSMLGRSKFVPYEEGVKKGYLEFSPHAQASLKNGKPLSLKQREMVGSLTMIKMLAGQDAQERQHPWSNFDEGDYWFWGNSKRESATKESNRHKSSGPVEVLSPPKKSTPSRKPSKRRATATPARGTSRRGLQRTPPRKKRRTMG